MIKRTQFVYGSLFTVSGVMCAFRKRALQDAGWWAPGTLTDDVDVSWRVQLAGWGIAYEPKAICWILMPETLKGLWRQRLRWAQGGSATAFSSFKAVFARRRWGMLVIWINFMAGICWAYLAVIGIVLGLVNSGVQIFGAEMPFFRPMPDTWPAILAITYFLQALVSVAIDSRYEPGLMRSFFWLVWYPAAFWLIQAFTAVVGVPKALLRPKGGRGVWISPDRGFR
jgi:biofilm PGA synthesis N-glycosyltransferase PgaC